MDEAVRHYRTALHIQCDHAQAHKRLGILLVGRNDWDSAIDYLRQAVELDPEDVEVRQNLDNVRAMRAAANRP